MSYENELAAWHAERDAHLRAAADAYDQRNPEVMAALFTRRCAGSIDRRNLVSASGSA
jgi:hypothetical protein